MSNNKIEIYTNYIFKNERCRLNSSLKEDLNYLLQSTTDNKIFKGGLYIPEYICKKSDLTLFQKILKELETNKLIQWSKHLKIDNPTQSETFSELITKISSDFNMEIYASRLNYYQDGYSWKPFHHDSHAYGEVKEDITIGISLGSSRNLAFKHVETGEIFKFPQDNGDIFAFDKIVNKKFMHGVPKSNELTTGPRISIIVWGRRRETGYINIANNQPKKSNPLKEKMRNRRIVQ